MDNTDSVSSEKIGDNQNQKETSSLGIANKIVVWMVFIAFLTGVVWLYTSNLDSVEATSLIPTEANLKVAFIGDTDDGTSFVNVLNLIESEGAEAVFHQGDFDYGDNPNKFFSVIDTVLGSNFPYFASVGNHDVSDWNDGCGGRNGCYATYLKDRMTRVGITPDDPNLNDQIYSIVYKGLKVVFAGQETGSVGDTVYAPYIASQLENDGHMWKICSWHRNQTSMQIGGKDNDMGWNVYETCRQNGAIISTAHEHSYQRTKTLTSMQNQDVDTLQHPLDANNVPGNPNSLVVYPGRTFAFVSGLGGNSIRDQERCLPATYPYGCKYEWANIYTSNQGANYGALFITFNVDGDPGKAVGYFKNINGQTVDQFTVLTNSTATSQCSDTIDNDGDSLIDLGDPGCSGVYDNDETDPPPVDTISPLTVITNPTQNSFVPKRSTVIISVNASDNIGVTKVEFFVNNTLLCSDTIETYSCNWTVPNSPNKTYNLQTKAYDLAGNIGNSTVIQVKSK
jgi:hypothetical protein